MARKLHPFDKVLRYDGGVPVIMPVACNAEVFDVGGEVSRHNQGGLRKVLREGRCLETPWIYGSPCTEMTVVRRGVPANVDPDMLWGMTDESAIKFPHVEISIIDPPEFCSLPLNMKLKTQR